jgi:hypothetical protein
VRYDELLFAGAGKDLVGDQFIIWFQDEVPPAINAPAENRTLALLELEFCELIGIRDRCSPDTVIFVNCIDFPAVTGIPAHRGVGPWLKPSFDYL